MDREIPQEERRATRRRVIYISCGIAVLLAVAIYFVIAYARAGVDRADLKFAVVDNGLLEATVAATGKVVPAYEEIVNSPIDTRILEVFRKAGDSVEEGTPLFALDLLSVQTEYDQMLDQHDMLMCQLEQMRLNNNTYMTDLEMRVKVKEMAVNRMAVELRNEQYLDSLGSGTGDNVQQARLAYNTGRLELEQLRKQLANERQVKAADLQVKQLEVQVAEKSLSEMRRTLDDARIRSPRSGVLTFINNTIGERLAKGSHIATVSDLSHFKVDCQIADTYASRLQNGSRTLVKIAGDTLSGLVSNITPLSNGGVISFIVQLDNDSTSQLRSGLKTDVYVLNEALSGVMRLKKGPYYSGPGEYDMFVADASWQVLKRRTVRLGSAGFDMVEVKSGLEPGDKVVISDMSQFRQSSRLNIND